MFEPNNWRDPNELDLYILSEKIKSLLEETIDDFMFLRNSQTLFSHSGYFFWTDPWIQVLPNWCEIRKTDILKKL